LENCYFRYFKSYKTVCSEAHKYDDDFIYEDDGDEDDEDYEDDEEEDGFSWICCIFICKRSYSLKILESNQNEGSRMFLS